jgi:hypothetical protein
MQTQEQSFCRHCSLLHTRKFLQCVCGYVEACTRMRLLAAYGDTPSALKPAKRTIIGPEQMSALMFARRLFLIYRKASKPETFFSNMLVSHIYCVVSYLTEETVMNWVLTVTRHIHVTWSVRKLLLSFGAYCMFAVCSLFSDAFLVTKTI